MYNIKNQIFLNLTKTQKSALCGFLRAYVKKSPNVDIEKLLDGFLEDERYYLEINNPHFEFMEEYLEDEDFRREALSFMRECRKYYDYKKAQEPLIQAQKAYEKKKREFLKEVKMSHEPPTKKQLYYYERLCKKYNLEKKELSSKLEARNEIDKIIKEHEKENIYGLPVTATSNKGVSTTPVNTAYSINSKIPVDGLKLNARTWAHIDNAKPPNNNM